MARSKLDELNVTPTEAVALQRRLASRIRIEPIATDVRFIAGGDASFLDDHTIVAGWVVWDRRTGEAVDRSVVVRPCKFPYIPGLLSFREAPALFEAAGLIQSRPDLFMIDGQGIAHPRRLGLASHVGLMLDRPTIGCAKSRLCGDHAEPSTKRGSSRRLMHDGELIGRVVRTREGVKPLYISVGHRVTLDDAVRLVMRCATKFRLPEPTRLAHQWVTQCKRSGHTLPRPTKSWRPHSAGET